MLNVEPGQDGYVMNKIDAEANIKVEITSNVINFRDVESNIKESLKKAGYKPPN